MHVRVEALVALFSAAVITVVTVAGATALTVNQSGPPASEARFVGIQATAPPGQAGPADSAGPTR